MTNTDELLAAWKEKYRSNIIALQESAHRDGLEIADLKKRLDTLQNRIEQLTKSLLTAKGKSNV